MNFWWVNHSQTFRHEFFGKYIWSPKRKRNDQINPFYETMREVGPGDIVYSFADGAIRGFGMARTHCYTSPRPSASNVVRAAIRSFKSLSKKPAAR